MKNQPLNSNEQGGILIFLLILSPAVIFGIGVVPAIFLAAGVFFLKRNNRFSAIETAVRYFKIYNFVMLVIFIILTIYVFYQREDILSAGIDLCIVIMCAVYIKLVDTLFFKPLIDHSEWVEKNDIFSSKVKDDEDKVCVKKSDFQSNKPNTQNVSSLFIADELTKLSILKENGIITEFELLEIKSKLLNKI